MLLGGCGAQYRPVVSAINPVGPAGQPTKYAVAISSPSATQNGLATFVDFSGDSTISTPQILTNPSYFALSQSGGEAYVINGAGSLNDFPVGNPASLLTSDITQTTLAAATAPVSISVIAPTNASQTVFIPQTATSSIAVLNGGSSPSLLQQIAVAANPVYVVGANGAPRVYALSQGTTPGTSAGTASALEALSSSSLAVSATIPVGINPVYGVMTSDDHRAFLLNKGSGTVSVVNVTNNALDSTTPTITIPNITYSGGSAAPNPVWADLDPLTTELVVLNQGDGVHPGTLSIINIPLCNANTQTTNPLCNPANPVDANGFGTILANVPVGINPTMVSVLQDNVLPRAYVINQGNPSSSVCNGQGSVSVVNLIAGVVSATICGLPGGTGTAGDAYIHGHPNSVSATTGTPAGKVYVTSGDSKDLTILYTDTDSVQNHLTLQGTGLRVLVTAN